MLDVRTLQAQDLRGLAPEALVLAAEQMLQRIGMQSKQLDERDQRIAAQAKSEMAPLVRTPNWLR